jgi:MFS family permease
MERFGSDHRVQRWCAWSGLVFVLMLFLGLAAAGFIPPPTPHQSAESLKRLFVEHQTRILVGMLLGLLGTGFAGPFVAVITVQLKRVEGPFAPLAYAQLLLGSMLPIALVVGMSSLMVAAYRVDRDAESVQAFSDQAWFLIVGAFYMFVLQLACIGVAVLRDESERPVLPRWLGYLNLWCAIGSLPAAGVYFVETGPLAWNGLLSFWLPAICFGAWGISTMVMVLGAISRQSAPVEQPA